MPTDEPDRSRDASRLRYRQPEAVKEQRLRAVKARLTVGGEAPAAPPRSPRGWLGPAVFWTALIALGTGFASYWASQHKGDTRFRILAADVLELRRGADGHYGVPGTVAAEPVDFVVDTGATLTTISEETGRRIGIRACPAIGFDTAPAGQPGCCRPGVFSTANGRVDGCVARVPSLRFGAFEVRNVEVAVMPALGGPTLLGMNVLKHFSLAQQGNRLTISAPQAE